MSCGSRVRAQAWRDASLERCPNHPHGGCSFARHGTYARKTPRGTRIARWYCPESHTTFSLLPDCLAARLPGTLDEVEQVRDELFRRMDNAGVSAEWDDILRDLNALTETAITYKGKTFVVRSNTVGVAGKIAQCVGVRLPNTVRQIDDEKESADQSL